MQICFAKIWISNILLPEEETKRKIKLIEYKVELKQKIIEYVLILPLQCRKDCKV